MNKLLMLGLVLLIAVIPASAATYYIDYASGNDANNGLTTSTPWKNAPGMDGFTASYSHSAGDIFIFKGGVTWNSSALPLTIGYSGTSGNVDTYTTDESWYSGGSWSQPIFDLEKTKMTGIILDTKDYIKIDNLKLINPADQTVYNPMVSMGGFVNVSLTNCTIDGDNGNDTTPIMVANIDGLVIENNYIRGRGATEENPDGILIRPWFNIKNVTIRNNEITMLGTGGDGMHIDVENDYADYDRMFVGHYGPILIENNTFHDIAGGKTGIIFIGGALNVTVRYNKFYGDFGTGVGVRFGNAGQGYNGGYWYFKDNAVYYNLFYQTCPSYYSWGAMISNLDANMNAADSNNTIYNNVIYANGSYPVNQRGLWFESDDMKGWSIKNNIFMGLTTAIAGAPTNYTIDTNLFYNNNANGTVGTNPEGGNPLFTNESIYDFTLQSNSPAIDSGVDWGQTRDFIGTTKQGSGWDIGAYEYVSESETSSDYMPPSPTTISNTTGNFYVNHTWQAGSGNVTNSYNVSLNGTWYNTTTNLFYNSTTPAHGWSNISVYAYNSSGNGNLNVTSVSQNTRVPNNAPVQSTIGNKNVNEDSWLNFTISSTDVDVDALTYATNSTKGTLTTNNFSWKPTLSDSGTYYWIFNTTDNYSAVDTETIIITVNNIDFIPPVPLINSTKTGNFYVNTSWKPDSGNVTNSYNSTNETAWINNTLTYRNTTLSPHAWQNLTIYAYNSSYGNLSLTSLTNNTQIPNNPVTISNISDTYTLSEMDQLYIDANFEDLDESDTGTFAKNFTQGIINTSTGILTWAIPAGANGTYNWQITVSDGYGSISHKNFTVTVNSVTITTEILEQSIRNTLDEQANNTEVTTEPDFSYIMQRASDNRTFNYSHGSSTLTTPYESASTSKLPTAVIILTLVDDGNLTLDSKPSDLIDFWTGESTVTLGHLLNFTSGFNGDPAVGQYLNYTNCIHAYYNSTIGSQVTAGTEFNYSGSHLQIAGLMAIESVDKSWAQIFSDFQNDTGLFPNSTYDLPYVTNPRLAAGMTWTTEDYQKFLVALYNNENPKGGQLLTNGTWTQLFSNQRGDAVVSYSPMLSILGEDWAYGYGNWLECLNSSYNCGSMHRDSSPGAYGAYPFIDFDYNYFGIIGRQSPTIGHFKEGVDLFRTIQNNSNQWSQLSSSEYIEEGIPELTSVTNSTVTDTTAIITFTINQSSALTQVKYGINESLSSATTNQTTGTDRLETLTNLSSNTKYYYSVFAYNSTNTSLYSNSTIQNFTTTAAIPPASITSLTNHTGNFYHNWTWTNPSDIDFNYTEIYINGTWIVNTSNQYYNLTPVAPHNASTISTHTVDTSGNINTTWVNHTSILPNNNITITNTSGWSGNEGLTVYVNYNVTDPDSDTPTFSCNRTDLFTDFDTATGIGTWLTTLTDSGIYYIDFGVSDGYGSTSNYTMTITVNDVLFSPNITSYNPETPISDYNNITQREFNITINQSVNATWYINNTIVQTNSTLNNQHNYTNITPTIGFWSVLVIVNNTNGSDFTSWEWTVTDSSVNTYIPPSPEINTILTGSFYKNLSWIPGSGNITDSYNVSRNGTWFNGTSLYLNTTGLPHSWINDTIYAYNNTGLLSEAITNNTQMSNNAPLLTSIGNKNIYEGSWLNFTISSTDLDGDSLTYGTNASKGTLNTSNGNFNWSITYSDGGVYTWYFNTTDNYSAVDTETITVTVTDITPPASITNLGSGATVNSLTATWTNPTDTDFNYTMLYLNNVFKSNTSYNNYTFTNLLSSTYYTISTKTVDIAGNINASWVNLTVRTSQTQGGGGGGGGGSPTSTPVPTPTETPSFTPPPADRYSEKFIPSELPANPYKIKNPIKLEVQSVSVTPSTCSDYVYIYKDDSDNKVISTSCPLDNIEATFLIPTTANSKTIYKYSEDGKTLSEPQQSLIGLTKDIKYYIISVSTNSPGTFTYTSPTILGYIYNTLTSLWEQIMSFINNIY